MNDEYNGQGGCYTLDKNGNRVPITTQVDALDADMADPVVSATEAKSAKATSPTE